MVQRWLLILYNWFLVIVVEWLRCIIWFLVCIGLILLVSVCRQLICRLVVVQFWLVWSWVWIVQFMQEFSSDVVQLLCMLFSGLQWWWFGVFWNRKCFLDYLMGMKLISLLQGGQGSLLLLMWLKNFCGESVVICVSFRVLLVLRWVWVVCLVVIQVFRWFLWLGCFMVVFLLWWERVVGKLWLLYKFCMKSEI